MLNMIMGCGFLREKILGYFTFNSVPQYIMIAINGAVSRLHGSKIGRCVVIIVISKYRIII